MNIEKVHTSKRYGFQYAQVKGTGDADHASWWSFDDEQIVRDRHWHIKPDDTVLDIGAAFGSYALPALAMGARVVAFSPADFDTELLQINLGLNPELARRCLVVRDGVYSQDGWFCPDHSAFENDDSYGGEGICNNHEAWSTRGRDTESEKGCGWLHCRSLDSFLASRPGIDRVDWIKMDIEGAEFEALKGMAECLRRWHPKILVELHLFHDQQLDRKCIDYLRDFGYSCDGPYQHCAVSHAFFECK